MASILPDPSTPFGQRVAQRLREEPVAWIVTTGADGTPQPNPVWFLWDGQSILIYTMNGARRLEHIQRNPRVAFHFNTDAGGDDVVVITGEARIATGEPPATQNAAFLAKYAGAIKGIFGEDENAAAQFAAQYSVPVRITPKKVRGL